MPGVRVVRAVLGRARQLRRRMMLMTMVMATHPMMVRHASTPLSEGPDFMLRADREACRFSVETTCRYAQTSRRIQKTHPNTCRRCSRRVSTCSCVFPFLNDEQRPVPLEHGHDFR